MQAADLRQRVAGQGDVDAVALEALLELARRQLLGAPLDRCFQRLASLVGRLAGGRALLRCKLGDVAQEIGQLGLAPQILDAHVLQCLGVGCAGDRVFRLGAYLLDSLGHSGAILRLSSYRAMVAAMAAFRESIWIGM